jgi:hypothetical protein
MKKRMMKTKNISGWIINIIMVVILLASFFSGLAIGRASGYTEGYENAIADYERHIADLVNEIEAAVIATNVIAQRASELLIQIERRLAPQ